MKKGLTGLTLGFLLMLCGICQAQQHTVHYYYTDPQGTVLAEADAAGNITATYDYSPYGTAAPSMNPAPNGPGYTGHVNDPETGLVYMQARYYDPATGRFLSVDPQGPEPGNGFNFNRYDYANNNPVVNIDPNGQESSQLTMQGIEATKSEIKNIPVPVIKAALLIEASILLEPIAGEAFGPIRAAYKGENAAAKLTQLEKNVAQGKAGETATKAKYADQISGQHVTIKTSDGTRTVTDFVTKDQGIIETKTGNATLSKGQTKLFDDINAGREVTPVGKNAANAGLEPGKPVVMRSCTVDRC